MLFRQYSSSLLISLKKAFKSLFLLASIVTLSSCTLPVFASNQSTTITQLVISPQLLAPIVFSVNPGNIFVGEKITFNLGPAITPTNVILNNIPCEIWIKPANASNYIVLSGITNNAGTCSYQSDKTLTEQNLVLLTQPLTPDFPRPSGTQNLNSQSSNPGFNIGNQAVGGNTNLSSINSVVGGGTGFGLVIYQGSSVLSNTVTYTVNGAVTDIGTDYPTDNGGGTGNGNNSSRSTTNSSSNNNRNVFDFLPRTGGFAVSIGLVVAIILLIIFVISRKQSEDEKDSVQK